MVARRVLLSAGLTLAVIAGLSSVASAATKKYSAEVRRTSYGIPHIKANDYGGLGYGSGYAFAQDNICTLADEIVTVRGERSRYFGPDARTVASAKVSDRNLDSDFLFQSYHDRKVVETLLKKKPPMGPSPEIRAMVKGYAAGYDRYLKDTGVKKIPDKRCRGKAWVKPISALDLWYRYYQLALIASALNFTDGLVAAEPPAGSAKAAGALPTSDEAIAWWKAHLPDRERIGSNAIGLGSQGTQSGNGMVLGNPHFPWYGGERFYQFQLTLPGKLDVQGASLYGVPVVNIGFNRHVAWSHTVSTAWRFTPFRLQLAPNDPTAYVVDGKTEKMTSRTVSVKLKDGSTQKHTFWYSRYGQLVTVAQAGYGWDKQYAYALGDVNAENLRIADVWLALDKAKSVDDLVKAQSRYQGVPWVNTIAADDKGQALYQDNSVVPHVTDQQQKDCIPAGLPAIVHTAAGIITLDGSRSACAWGSDPDAVAKGIFGPKKLPVLKRRDYVQNSNDSYWMTNSKVPITGIPTIVGDTNVALGLRTRYGLREINERLAGSDGESGKGYTLAQLRSMWSSADSEAGLLLKNQLADFCATSPTVDIGGGKVVDISAACPIVRNWDASAKLDSKGDWLFNLWWHFSGNVFADKFDPANPLTTPNQLATTHDNLVALGKAVQELRDRGLPLDATTRQVQFLERRGVKIPVRGCDTGCYADIDGSVDPAGDSKSSGIPIKYGQVLYGSSIVETIELTKKGPKGGTILTYSESENPDSKHSGDQTKLFSENGWVPVTFTEKQILGNKDLKTTKLSGR